MPRISNLLLALTLTTVTSAAFAQNDDQQSGQMNNPPMQSQAAPIERAPENPPDGPPPNPNEINAFPVKLTPGQVLQGHRGSASAIAAPGVFLRVGRGSDVRAITLTNENTELKVERGVANISVHSAIKHAQILIDLPGGQTNLIKDGFYTFNANTNTVRVLKGEAYAYPGTGNMQAKPIKIKENHAVIFNGPDIRSFEFDPFEARADLIPYTRTEGQNPGPGYYGPYAGYPYYDYGYPYYWGLYYPYYFGFGWGGGYYGGWGGGYRGGWGGGRGGFGGGGHGGGGRH